MKDFMNGMNYRSQENLREVLINPSKDKGLPGNNRIKNELLTSWKIIIQDPQAYIEKLILQNPKAYRKTHQKVYSTSN